MKNIVYLDTTTNRIKTTTYVKFEEAHFSHSNKPPGARILIELGAKSTLSEDVTSSNPTLQIVRRDPAAIVPKKGSDDSAGYDLFSITECSIPPNGVSIIDTDIAAKFTPNTYGRIASRSGLALHNHVETKGGVIDPDYTGNIKIILHNFGANDFHVKKSDQVAQLILEQYLSPHVHLTTKLPPTKRSTDGFGSTGITDKPNPTHHTTHHISYEPDEIAGHTHINKSVTQHELNGTTLI